MIQSSAPSLDQSTTTSTNPATEESELMEIQNKLSGNNLVSSSGGESGLPYKVTIKNFKIYN